MLPYGCFSLVNSTQGVADERDNPAINEERWLGYGGLSCFCALTSTQVNMVGLYATELHITPLTKVM